MGDCMLIPISASEDQPVGLISTDQLNLEGWGCGWMELISRQLAFVSQMPVFIVIITWQGLIILPSQGECRLTRSFTREWPGCQASRGFLPITNCNQKETSCRSHCNILTTYSWKYSDFFCLPYQQNSWSAMPLLHYYEPSGERHCKLAWPGLPVSMSVHSFLVRLFDSDHPNRWERSSMSGENLCLIEQPF